MADLQVVIQGKDGVSRIFQDVGKSAQQAGKQVEQAGKQGEQGFKRVGEGAKGAKVDIDAFAGALTVVGAGLAYAGNAALDQKQTIIGLQAAYGDAADEYIRFADELASRSIFNDDDILKGERYFATLRNNYELTDQQIQQLMQTTADLASAYGTSFEDASSRITAAIRGEGEAAEFLGLTMNQQSIDRENLTLSMSNQEAAQFRLNALYEQTGVYQGTAQKLAESEVGTRARLTNAIQDNAQALGNFIGPMGSMVAGMGFAATGIASMVTSFGNLGPAMRNAVAAARSSQLAITAVGIATNPVALGLGALAVAGIATWSMFQDGRVAAKNLEDALISLGDVATNLRLGHRDQEASFVDQFLLDVQQVQIGAEALLDDQNRLNERAKEVALPFENYVDVIERLKREYSLSDDEANKFAEAQTKVGAAFADSRVDHVALNEALRNMREEYDAGRINLDQYLAGIIVISQNLDAYRSKADDAADATDALGTSFGKTGAAAFEMAGAVAELGAQTQLVNNVLGSAESIIDNVARAARDGAVDLERMADLTARTTDRGREGKDVFNDYADASAIAFDRQSESAGRARDAMEAHAEAVSEANQAMAEWIEQSADTGQFLDYWLDLNRATEDTATGVADLSPLVQKVRDDFIFAGQGGVLTMGTLRGEIERLGTAIEGLDFAGVVQMTAHLEDSARALDAVLATFGRIDDLGQRSEKSGSIAENLIGAPGEWATIDDLVSNAAISQQTYNEAVAAGYRIQDSNVRVQEDLNAIRAAQLPLLAQEQLAYEANIAALAGLPAEQQRYALALQDTAVQSQIAAQYATAYSASVGEIPEQVATDMIVNTANADPQLAELLVKMGLLEEVMGPDGKKTYSVNFPDAESTADTLGEINDTLVAIGDLLDDDTLNRSFKISVEFDTGKATGDVLSGMAGAAMGGITVPVDADTEPAKAGIAAIADEVEPVTVPVQFAAIGASAASSVAGMAQSALGNVQQDVTVEINAVDNASAVIGEVITFAASVDGYDVTVDVATNGALQSFNNLESVEKLADRVDGKAPTVDVSTPGAGPAMVQLAGVALAAESIPDIANVDVGAIGASEAEAALWGVAIAAQSIPSSVTTTVTTVLETVRTSARHGGIPGYAHGGVVAELAESGPELLHLAGGGVVPVYDRGLYSVPHGTYVSPNNAMPGPGGISVTFTGDFYGSDRRDLDQWAEEDLIPSMIEAIYKHKAGHGGLTV